MSRIILSSRDNTNNLSSSYVRELSLVLGKTEDYYSAAIDITCTDIGAAGAIQQPSFGNHRHGVSLGTLGDLQTCSISTGTLGVSESFIRADHRHGLQPPSVVANVSTSTCTVGISSACSREDHVHFNVAGAAVVPKTIASTPIDYTMTANDCVVVCDKITTLCVYLLSATGSGRENYIKNINSGPTYICAQVGDVIDDVGTQILSQWDALSIIDVRANAWIIL